MFQVNIIDVALNVLPLSLLGNFWYLVYNRGWFIHWKMNPHVIENQLMAIIASPTSHQHMKPYFVINKAEKEEQYKCAHFFRNSL